VEHVFLHLVGSEGHIVHSGVFGMRNVDALFFMIRAGLVQIPQKLHRDMLRQTFVFATGGIC
jgi:hypothetical protein